MSDAGESLGELEELLACVFADDTRRGPGCWAARLQGPAAQFVAELERAIAAGRRPVWARVAQVLRERFDIRRDQRVVARHFKRDCSCRT